MNETPLPTPIPALSLDLLTKALGDVTRWRFLLILAPSEPLMVIEIAAQAGCSPTLASKHLAKLRKAGLVETGRAGLYRIPRVFLQTPGVVDFGHCTLPIVPAAPLGF